ncbi:hypothetical protein NHX12_001616 [Muraenolepis orangiensis]|uniref:Uncharacterized protein n=1 Tax=Muraenolepis orangiensis TaxID=630683 RepID=A0A9Q0E046_9TELE|nr:hypothetical protein NHX12_001616 [Muraenolepis orangiensis]
MGIPSGRNKKARWVDQEGQQGTGSKKGRERSTRPCSRSPVSGHRLCDASSLPPARPIFEAFTLLTTLVISQSLTRCETCGVHEVVHRVVCRDDEGARHLGCRSTSGHRSSESQYYTAER